MLKFIIAAVALLAMAFLASCGGSVNDAVTPTPSETAAPARDTPTPIREGLQVYRWVNVTVVMPDVPGLTVIRNFGGPRGDTPVLLVWSMDRSEALLIIDAEKGWILEDRAEAEERAVIDSVLETLTFSLPDRRSLPWPYSGGPPNVPREKWGRIMYIPPDPATGLEVVTSIGDGEGGGGSAIQLTNTLSFLSIDADTGEVFAETTSILPEDKESFDRFLSTVQYVGP